MRNVSDKLSRENHKAHFAFHKVFVFQKSCLFWENVEEYCRAGRPQITVRHVLIACRMLSSRHS